MQISGHARAHLCLLFCALCAGGKSTLLRQTCCAVILAQVGCWIPAESCKLTPVDRIFTRVGANDAIMAGKSTFLVELSETSVILKNATSKSLVILDELGQRTHNTSARIVRELLCAVVSSSLLFSLFVRQVAEPRRSTARPSPTQSSSSCLSVWTAWRCSPATITCCSTRSRTTKRSRCITWSEQHTDRRNALRDPHIA